MTKDASDTLRVTPLPFMVPRSNICLFPRTPTSSYGTLDPTIARTCGSSREERHRLQERNIVWRKLDERGAGCGGNLGSKQRLRELVWIGSCVTVPAAWASGPSSLTSRGHGAVDVVGPVAPPGRAGGREDAGVYTDRRKWPLGAILGHLCTLLRRELRRIARVAPPLGWRLPKASTHTNPRGVRLHVQEV